MSVPNPWFLCPPPDKEFLVEQLGDVQKIYADRLKENKDPASALHPMIIAAVKTKEGKQGLCIGFIEGKFTPRERDIGFRKFAEALYKECLYPGVLYLATEAWCASAEEGRYEAPRHREDRQECLLIHGETAGGDQCASRAIFTRDKRNRPVLEEWAMLGGNGMESVERDTELSDMEVNDSLARGDLDKVRLRSPLQSFWEEYSRLAGRTVESN